VTGSQPLVHSSHTTMWLQLSLGNTFLNLIAATFDFRQMSMHYHILQNSTLVSSYYDIQLYSVSYKYMFLLVCIMLPSSVKSLLYVYTTLIKFCAWSLT
jgi:hypothetical protein